MIKVGITGGSNPMAGELVRLLINHPDINLNWVSSARYAGRLVSDVHHGLLGETDLRVSPDEDLESIDVLFIFRHKGQTIEWLESHDIPEELRIVDLSVDMRDTATAEKYGFVYGLPELNRKAMVRGATRVVLPHPAANAVLLCLLPLAKDGAIRKDISATVSLPKLSEQTSTEREIINEVIDAVHVLQPDAFPRVSLSSYPAADPRVLTAIIDMPTDLNIGELTRMFEEFYDDHNFVFIVGDKVPGTKEVAGTDKCLIHLDKREGILTATLVFDSLLKGAAGTAVHDMNLLFGLHERTGLALKASTF